MISDSRREDDDDQDPGRHSRKRKVCGNDESNVSKRGNKRSKKGGNKQESGKGERGMYACRIYDLASSV